MEGGCFAERRYGYCSATSEGRCLGYGQCPFFKSKEDANQSTQEAYARLRQLPKEQQLCIAGKYYQGHMPWKGRSL